MDLAQIISFIVGFLGLILGVAGFAYALHQGTERRKLAQFVRSQNWHLYTKENNANGSLQLAIAEYKKVHQQDLSAGVLELLGRADAFSQDVFKDIARQIQLAEKTFTNEAIDKWVSDGKVNELHAKLLFRPIVVEN